MPAAKARKLNITAKDTETRKGGGGDYAKLVVPEDYEAVCTSVEDYVKKGANKVTGWLVKYDIEGLSFNYHLSFSEAARWKIVQTFEAHGFDLSEGVAELDPNALVGDHVGAHVDWDDAEAFKEIKWVFSLDDVEAADEAVAEIVAVDPEDALEEEPEIL